jgi:hypothetical protein
MVGFASAGPRFTTHVHDENIWAFRVLSLLLAVSRFLLSIQYSVIFVLLLKPMSETRRGLHGSAIILTGTGFAYYGVSL